MWMRTTKHSNIHHPLPPLFIIQVSVSVCINKNARNYHTLILSSSLIFCSTFFFSLAFSGKHGNSEMRKSSTKRWVCWLVRHTETFCPTVEIEKKMQAISLLSGMMKARQASCLGCRSLMLDLHCLHMLCSEVFIIPFQYTCHSVVCSQDKCTFPKVAVDSGKIYSKGNNVDRIEALSSIPLMIFPLLLLHCSPFLSHINIFLASVLNIPQVTHQTYMGSHPSASILIFPSPAQALVWLLLFLARIWVCQKISFSSGLGLFHHPKKGGNLCSLPCCDQSITQKLLHCYTQETTLKHGLYIFFCGCNNRFITELQYSMFLSRQHTIIAFPFGVVRRQNRNRKVHHRWKNVLQQKRKKLLSFLTRLYTKSILLNRMVLRNQMKTFTEHCSLGTSFSKCWCPQTSKKCIEFDNQMLCCMFLILKMLDSTCLWIQPCGHTSKIYQQPCTWKTAPTITLLILSINLAQPKASNATTKPQKDNKTENGSEMVSGEIENSTILAVALSPIPKGGFCPPGYYLLYLDYHCYDKYCTDLVGNCCYCVFRPKEIIRKLRFQFPTMNLAQFKALVLNHLRPRSLDYVIIEPGVAEQRGMLWYFNQETPTGFDRFFNDIQRSSMDPIVWIHIAMPHPGDLSSPIFTNDPLFASHVAQRGPWGAKRPKIENVTFNLSIQSFSSSAKSPLNWLICRGVDGSLQNPWRQVHHIAPFYLAYHVTISFPYSCLHTHSQCKFPFLGFIKIKSTLLFWEFPPFFIGNLSANINHDFEITHTS
ncbi:hypothetical protein VP01_1545g1 [Puccinia sorghi]|uniref:Uncharacterized protein n=1 Tax=Puccinia sorghi TaxID=27349 RepID=A0A0L6VIF0_9BASI|nr:hypothetical protein VP01_1545g1 [Puccinia sorghi]